jgi:hypothetical protein
MDQATPVSTIAHLIQLAIAPVFLLAGIGAILNVLAQRLARVVDRARVLESDYGTLDDGECARVAAELLLLDRRMRVVNHAISACTASALFVCLVIGILFVAELADIAWGRPTAVLFIAAMLLLTSGLLLFLYEIRLAMRAIKMRRATMPLRQSG